MFVLFWRNPVLVIPGWVWNMEVLFKGPPGLLYNPVPNPVPKPVPNPVPNPVPTNYYVLLGIPGLLKRPPVNPVCVFGCLKKLLVPPMPPVLFKPPRVPVVFDVLLKNVEFG